MLTNKPTATTKSTIFYSSLSRAILKKGYTMLNAQYSMLNTHYPKPQTLPTTDNDRLYAKKGLIWLGFGFVRQEARNHSSLL